MPAPAAFPLPPNSPTPTAQAAARATTVPCPTEAAPGARAARRPAGDRRRRAAVPAARAARAFSLNESAPIASRPADTASRSTSGALPRARSRGTIYVHLKIVSTNRVIAEVNIYPPEARSRAMAQRELSAAAARSRASPGRCRSTRGTGSYAHAHGSGLSFSGTIGRSNEAITVHVAAGSRLTRRSARSPRSRMLRATRPGEALSGPSAGSPCARSTASRCVSRAGEMVAAIRAQRIGQDDAADDDRDAARSRPRAAS